MVKRYVKLNRGFTLLEIVVIMAVILILGSIAVISYRGYVNRAKEAVCVENLNVLNGAVKTYLLENEVLPAVLGDLKLEQLEKAYAYVIQDRDWFTKFARFFLKMNTSSQAYAQFLTYENLKKYGMTEKIFHCPEDENGGASYGINGNLSGKGIANINESDTLIGDSDNYVFSGEGQLAKRHRHGKIAIMITMGGQVKKIDNSSSDDGGHDDGDDDGDDGGHDSGH